MVDISHQNTPMLYCPVCAYARSWIVRRCHRKCKRCRHEWSPRTQYPVPRIRVSRNQWIAIIDAFLDHGTRSFVMRRTGLGQFQVRAALRHLRHAMTEDTPPPFTGISEADETYVGGSWKNHRGALWIRKRHGKPGRGTPKRPVLGLRNRSTGLVRVWCIPNSRTDTIIRCLRDQVVPGSAVYSDGWQPYRHLPEYGLRHKFVDHNGGEFIRGRVHTQGIEGVWGYLKRKLAAMGGIRSQYLPLFIGELIWRYNHRKLTQVEQIYSLLELL